MTNITNQVTGAEPGSVVDQLSQDVAQLKQDLLHANNHVRKTDELLMQVLQLVKQSEGSFELRVAKSLSTIYAGFTHSLEHIVDDYIAKLKASQRGFTVELVDGATHLQNDKSIVVTKRVNGTYDFYNCNDTSVAVNQGTEAFVQYFEEHPHYFADEDTIVINVHALAQPEESNVQT